MKIVVPQSYTLGVHPIKTSLSFSPNSSSGGLPEKAMMSKKSRLVL